MNNSDSPTPVFRLATRATIVGLCFALSLVLFSFVVEGPTLARRSATDLVMPTGLIWLASFSSAIFFAFRGERFASFVFGVGFVFIGITANTYVASKFIQFVEWPEEQPTATKEKPYRSVIVLGGGGRITPLHTAELHRDGERLFSAAQLWHAGLVRSIICTGSTPRSVGHPQDISAQLLESVGVPSEVIYKVSGETTIEEMEVLKQFLEDPPADFPDSGEIALITSASHMRRAMRLASVKKLDFHPLPSGYRSTFFSGWSPHRMIPNAEAADDFGSAFRERLAGLVGR